MICKTKDCLDNMGDGNRDFKYGCVAWGDEAPQKCKDYKSDKAQAQLDVDCRVIKPVAIPLEYKCSKCKKDLRDASKRNKCECNKSHPFAGNRSGDKTTSMDLKYDGYSYKVL